MFFSSVFCQISFVFFFRKYVAVVVIGVALFCGRRFVPRLPKRLVGFQHHKRTLFIFIITVKGFFFFFPIVNLIGKKFILVIYVQRDVLFRILF